MDYRIDLGDCRDSLRAMAARGERVQMCVTSPPYFGLRSYLPDGHPDKAREIGLEQTPEEYIAGLVEVFRCVREVLSDDGTLWVNIGDSYASTAPGTRNAPQTKGSKIDAEQWANFRPDLRAHGIKPKDLIGIPWMLAFTLRADGWYLRQDIIWRKPNPMPESVTDRCTKSHEYLFLLSKGAQYHYDHEAVKEPAAASSLVRWAQDLEHQAGSNRVPGKTNGPMKAVGGSRRYSFARTTKDSAGEHGQKPQFRADRADVNYAGELRNRRSVWDVPTRPYRGAHFATFPPGLIAPCVLAGSRPGDVVLDPFGGSGTTAGVAIAHGRRAVLCELNPEYAELVPGRVEAVLQLLARHAKPPRKPPRQPSPAQMDLLQALA